MKKLIKKQVYLPLNSLKISCLSKKKQRRFFQFELTFFESNFNLNESTKLLNQFLFSFPEKIGDATNYYAFYIKNS